MKSRKRIITGSKTYCKNRTNALLLCKRTLQVNSSKEEEWLNIQESSGQNPLGIL